MSDYLGAKLVSSHTYQVEVVGITNNASPEYFYKVQGLECKLEMKAVWSGGVNRPYALPVGIHTRDLVLIRPLMEGKSQITVWCETAIDSLLFKLTQIQILVLNTQGGIIAQWTAEDAYPKSIEVSALDVRDPVVMCETITIGYARLVQLK